MDSKDQSGDEAAFPAERSQTSLHQLHFSRDQASSANLFTALEIAHDGIQILCQESQQLALSSIKGRPESEIRIARGAVVNK